jgi:hypothetical protein
MLETVNGFATVLVTTKVTLIPDLLLVVSDSAHVWH